jgi:LPS export ABC transporter protein LptC
MKKKNLLYIILAIIVVIACLWAFISASIITEKFKDKIRDNTLGKQEVNIQNLLITETKDDKKSWELFADEGFYDNENQVAILNNIVGNFYRGTEVVASFQATQGTYNQTNKQIKLYDKTIIVYKDGTNISANRISWQGKDTDVIAEGQIRLELPSKVVVKADKAVLKSNFEELKVIGRTRTEIYDKSNMESIIK